MTEFEAKTILSPLLMIYRLRGQFRKSERTFLTRSLEEVIRNSHPIDFFIQDDVLTANLQNRLGCAHSLLKNALSEYVETGVAVWADVASAIDQLVPLVQEIDAAHNFQMR